MLEILAIDPESIAEELELEAGDLLLSINGQPIRDLIDVEIFSGGEDLVLEVQKKGGEVWEIEVEKDAGDPLGLHFPHPEPTQCGNNCLFCFVHQLPRGMRRSLYVKDEDYRFSYLYGSYVTLTNIGEEEIRRIIDQQLSPLYVSVHATDDQLRNRLLGREAPSILGVLRRLIEGGIQLHTQVVLCPGINDGEHLAATVRDLHALAPGIASLAVVPVGLTGYRERLPRLRPPTAEEAQEVLALLGRFQDDFLRTEGARFVYAADELYLKAGRPFPPLDAYEDLPQVENGVGMIPLFRARASSVLDRAAPLRLPSLSTVTGESFAAELEVFAAGLRQRARVDIVAYPIVNTFFGGQVTVTGLITGGDLLQQLKGKPLGQVLLIPDVVLREGEEVFLDNVTLDDLGRELDVEIMPIDSTPEGLWDALEALSQEGEF